MFLPVHRFTQKHQQNIQKHIKKHPKTHHEYNDNMKSADRWKKYAFKDFCFSFSTGALRFINKIHV